MDNRTLGERFWSKGVDLISDFEHPKIAIEIERRSIWKAGHQYPYSTIHIPYRKAKYFGNTNTHYVIVNDTFTELGICTDE